MPKPSSRGRSARAVIVKLDRINLTRLDVATTERAADAADVMVVSLELHESDLGNLPYLQVSSGTLGQAVLPRLRSRTQR
jgi:hypothetical protein